MNDDQLYYFLVDKNTRNVLQIEYPSDIDEFNKILGTSEGKGSLLKDLGIILGSETRVFKNPEQVVVKQKVEEPVVEVIAAPKQAKKAATTKKAKPTKEAKEPVAKKQVNLFAGLFD